jgi:hypothetical protein
MGQDASTEGFIVVSVPIPKEIYINFSLAVLRKEGPKKKTKVLVDLMKQYAEQLVERGQGVGPASLAFSSANPPATEGG